MGVWQDIGALFTPTEKTKLSGIDTGATDDQTGAEIKTAYEGEADTNAYNDAAVTKLAGIAAAATKYPDTGEQAFLDADHTKLDGVEASADVTDQSNVESVGAIMQVSVWVEYNDVFQNIALGTIPAHSYIHRILIDVDTAFDDSGADTIEMGISTDHNKFGLSTDVSTTGRKTPGDGVGVGYNSTSQAVIARVTGGNLDANYGKALCVVEYWTVPTRPADE